MKKKINHKEYIEEIESLSMAVIDCQIRKRKFKEAIRMIFFAVIILGVIDYLIGLV